MGVRSSALAITVICSGVLIYIVAAYPPVCGWGKDFWGDVGTWVGGFGSIAAAVVALWLAGDANRRQMARDAATAESIATAICNELVGNCFDLEHGLAALDTKKHPFHDLDTRFLHLRDGLKNPRTSTFRLFKDQMHCFDVRIASAVNIIYGGLIVCEGIENAARQTLESFNEGDVGKMIEWKEQYIKERGSACESLLESATDAVRLIWPMTEYVSFSAPVTSVEQKDAFEAAKKAKRSS